MANNNRKVINFFLFTFLFILLSMSAFSTEQTVYNDTFSDTSNWTLSPATSVTIQTVPSPLRTSPNSLQFSMAFLAALRNSSINTTIDMDSYCSPSVMEVYCRYSYDDSDTQIRLEYDVDGNSTDDWIVGDSYDVDTICSSTGWTLINTSLPDQNYPSNSKFRIRLETTVGNGGGSIFIDDFAVKADDNCTIPSSVVTFVSPTPDNDTYINTNYTYINITTDKSVDNATLTFNGTEYSMTGSGTNWYYNVTGLTDCDDINYNVTVSDGGISETRVLRVSLTDPVINWVNPSFDGEVFIDDFNVSANILNCNLTDINLTLYNETMDVVDTYSVNDVDASSYNLIYETNVFSFPFQNYTIEICADNKVGGIGCSNRTFRMFDNLTTMNNIFFKNGDITVSGDTYQTILNFTYNKTTSVKSYLKIYSTASKTLGGTSTLYARITVNGVELYDDAVRTFTSSTDVGFLTLPFIDFTGIAGENNILVELREEGSGAINLEESSLILDFATSKRSKNIQTEYGSVDLTFSSTNYINVANITINQTQTGKLFLDSQIKYTKITGTGSSTPSCYVTINGHDSIEAIRYLDSPSDIGSSGLKILTDDETTGLQTYMAFCKSDNTDTISVETTYVIYSLVDEDDSKIPSLHAHNETPQSYTGTENILYQTNYTVQRGDKIQFIGSFHIQSTTGAQDGANSPVLYLVVNSNCTDIRRRSLSDNDDIGSVNPYFVCNNVEPGQNITATVYLNVSAGETLNVLNSAFSLFEQNTVTAVESPTAPLVFINHPPSGSTLWYDEQDINLTVFDPNLDSYTCNVTLDNTVNSSFYLIAENFNQTVKVNYTDYPFGNYDMRANCIDSTNLTGFDEINVDLFCSENWVEQTTTCQSDNTQIKYYLDQNSCGTTFDLPVDNGTTVGCDFTNMDLETDFIKDDLVLGEELSLLSTLFQQNSTQKISNAQCVYTTYYENGDQITLLDEQIKQVYNRGIVQYTIDSNDWIYKTEDNLVGQNVTLKVSCSCDVSSVTEEQCILSNGTRINEYLFASEEYNILITDDKSIHQTSLLTSVAIILVIIIILGYLALTIDKKHTAIKAIMYFSILFMGDVLIMLWRNSLLTSTKATLMLGFTNTLLTIYNIFLIVVITYYMGFYIINFIKSLSNNGEDDD